MAKKTTKKTEEQVPQDLDKRLDLALGVINKTFGRGSISHGDDFPVIERIPSGSIGLDQILGGGYAVGRIIEVYGPESSGKTTLCLHAIAETQKQGKTAAFVDAEHALDGTYASNLGVDMDRLVLSQPGSGEQALEIVDILVRSGAVSLIVVDSVAALTPQAEIEGDMSKNLPGLQARLMSKAMRKLANICYDQKCTIIFINQIRMKIGVMFGSPETTTGGKALKFYASQILDIRRKETLKDGETKIGIRTKVKVTKNKTAPPFREVEFNIMFGQGIDWATDLLDRAVEKGSVAKSGAWYSRGEERLGQGAANAAAFLREKPELADQLREEILGSKTA